MSLLADSGKVRESQGIRNGVKENHSIMITLVRWNRIVTQQPVSIDQGKVAQVVSYLTKHLSIKYFCSYCLVFLQFSLSYYLSCKEQQAVSVFSKVVLYFY